MNKRVVITGIGVVSPLGCDIDRTWKNVLENQSGVGPITLFDASNFPCRIAAEVRNFHINEYIKNYKFIKILNRSAQFGVSAAQMAIEDANLKIENDISTSTGILLSSSGSQPELDYINSVANSIDKSDYPDTDPISVIKRNPNTGACVISMLNNITGLNSIFSTACAGSSQAIGTAFRMIQQDDANIMITGGYESLISEIDIIGFSLLGALSTRNDDPQRASRPFDRERDGFVFGEGAAVIVLEELSHALDRGANIYGELAGYGCSLSAYSITDMPPDGDGAVQAMEMALLDANLKKNEIDYINAHGTSTQANDRSETMAIKRVFGDHAYKIPVSSTKSMTGHLIAAAGGIELAFSILSLRDSIIPPTINYENPDSKCDLDYVPNEARRAEINAVLSNSFAFGGNNSCLAVKRYTGGDNV